MKLFFYSFMWKTTIQISHIHKLINMWDINKNRCLPLDRLLSFFFFFIFFHKWRHCSGHISTILQWCERNAEIEREKKEFYRNYPFFGKDKVHVDLVDLVLTCTEFYFCHSLHIGISEMGGFQSCDWE